MAEQQVPNLQEMDEREAHRFLTDLYSRHIPKEEYGRVLNFVVISELRDGKMWRDRWYFAEPFEVPEWRAQWVERMDP
jgi:hypothetical protein